MMHILYLVNTCEIVPLAARIRGNESGGASLCMQLAGKFAANQAMSGIGKATEDGTAAGQPGHRNRKDQWIKECRRKRMLIVIFSPQQIRCSVGASSVRRCQHHVGNRHIWKVPRFH